MQSWVIISYIYLSYIFEKKITSYCRTFYSYLGKKIKVCDSNWRKCGGA